MFRVRSDFFRKKMHYSGEIYQPETNREEADLIKTGKIEVIKMTEKVKASNLDELRGLYESKKGSKPHHLWKEARIKEEISKL